MNKNIHAFTFHYKMMDSKGILIKETRDKPLKIIEGKRQIFKPLESSLLNLNPGEIKRITVKCKEAFGEYNSNLLMQVPESEFQQRPKIGDLFNIESENGKLIKMRVADEKNGIYILDGNHQLAGVDLLFEIKLIERRTATPIEIKSEK
ncbi:MAG: FKBP-type peptidyl-prolyl cis-trans isomerase [Bdellovibrionales bacterium]|nr:FKBP-type peptidyl-prolyl cis-trans isomerase [Bdellovibrionales bacterium]